jgi:hypothetical protein
MTPLRKIAAAAAVSVMIGGLAACAPPPGGGGGGGIRTGCFINIQGAAYIKISPTNGVGHSWTAHTRPDCQDPAMGGTLEVYFSSTDAGAETWCEAVVGPTSFPQFIGNFLDPAQPRMFRCSGGPA